MRLTIDTSTDKPEDIQRAIKLLMGLVGSKVYHDNEEPKNYWNNTEQPKQEMQTTPEIGNLMSMFDTPIQTAVGDTNTTTQTAQELIDDLPKIELY